MKVWEQTPINAGVKGESRVKCEAHLRLTKGCCCLCEMT